MAEDARTELKRRLGTPAQALIEKLWTPLARVWFDQLLPAPLHGCWMGA